MKNLDYNPVYTETELVPKNLDLTFMEWRTMPLHELLNNLEILRIHIVENVINKKHDFFEGNKSITEIIKLMKNIDNFNDVELKKPPIVKSIRNNNIDYGSGILNYNSQRTSVINNWFPEKSFSKNVSDKSVNDQFYSKDQFLKNVLTLIVDDRFKFSEKYPNAKTSQFLKMGLRLVNGNQQAQNFPVDIAKWIILNYCSRKLKSSTDLFIGDPCMGWGSRLVSALAVCSNPILKSTKVHYFGTEANSSILSRYKMIVSFWKEYINSNINFELYHPEPILPYEDIFQDKVFKNMEGKFDLIFTSPPYYHAEKYSNDIEQSYIRYTNYDEDNEYSWKKNFLIPLFQNTYTLLKVGGEFWLNIADTGVSNKIGLNKIPLKSDSIEISKDVGFHYKSRYKISMPTHANFQKGNSSESTDLLLLDGKRRKAEPLFHFVKT